MTGLEIETDKVIEIACLVTSGDLDLVAEVVCHFSFDDVEYKYGFFHTVNAFCQFLCPSWMYVFDLCIMHSTLFVNEKKFYKKRAVQH